MRNSYNGSTPAFQAGGGGSIPLFRSIYVVGLVYYLHNSTYLRSWVNEELRCCPLAMSSARLGINLNVRGTTTSKRFREFPCQ